MKQWYKLVPDMEYTPSKVQWSASVPDFFQATQKRYRATDILAKK